MVVSAAAGATGSIAVQIAKILGCRVIGIAGTDEKCAWLVDDLGIDGAINHRTDDIPARLRELCPKRVDVFFDNTGGPILDHVLGRLADHARVVLCGAISSYNDHHKPPGPPNYLNLISRRARMEGFISWDYWGRWARDHRRRSAAGWPTGGCATARTCSRASSPPRRRSTPCSPARTSARSSSGWAHRRRVCVTDTQKVSPSDTLRP